MQVFYFTKFQIRFIAISFSFLLCSSYSYFSSCINSPISSYVLSKRHAMKLHMEISPEIDGFSIDDGNMDRQILPLGNTIKKNKSSSFDNRESLPYSIFMLKDELSKRNLGSYQLDMTTSCGDLVDLGDKGVYKVKRVAFLYKYTKQGFAVFKKKLDVVKANVSWDSKTTDSFLQ